MTERPIELKGSKCCITFVPSRVSAVFELSGGSVGINIQGQTYVIDTHSYAEVCAMIWRKVH